LEIIERVPHAIGVTTVTKLGTVDIVFPCSAVTRQLSAPAMRVLRREVSLHVVIAWVTVYKSIHEETVKREPPVIRRRVVCVVFVDSEVIQWIYSFLVHVQVPVDISLIIAKSLSSKGAQRQRQQPLAAHCVVVGSLRKQISMQKTDIQRQKGELAIGRYAS
jgi:hypothetical protein